MRDKTPQHDFSSFNILWRFNKIKNYTSARRFGNALIHWKKFPLQITFGEYTRRVRFCLGEKSLCSWASPSVRSDTFEFIIFRHKISATSSVVRPQDQKNRIIPTVWERMGIVASITAAIQSPPVWFNRQFPVTLCDRRKKENAAGQRNYTDRQHSAVYNY